MLQYQPAKQDVPTGTCGMAVIAVTSFFLTGSQLHRKEFMPSTINLVKGPLMTWPVMGPKCEPTTAVLLNRHAVKLLPKYFYLYSPPTGATLSLGQKASLDNEWWLIQRLVSGQGAENE